MPRRTTLPAVSVVTRRVCATSRLLIILQLHLVRRTRAVTPPRGGFHKHMISDFEACHAPLLGSIHFSSAFSCPSLVFRLPLLFLEAQLPSSQRGGPTALCRPRCCSKKARPDGWFDGFLVSLPCVKLIDKHPNRRLG